MQASYPVREGTIERARSAIHYEVHGEAGPVLFLLPTWSIVHSRTWKFQIADFSRDHRVLVMDGVGNGRSGRPTDPRRYADEEFARDALAVLDAAGLETATIAGLSAGARWALILAARHPERVERAVFVAPAVPLTETVAARETAIALWAERRESTDGWAKYNRHYWLSNHADFLQFFFEQCLTEPHSTKQLEDCVGWGLESSGEVLVATQGPSLDREEAYALAAQVRCPVLVVHGDEDAVVSYRRGAMLAAATGGRLVTFEGSGHLPHAREPVRFNTLLRDFMGPRALPERWRRALRRPRRVLYVSSPIGLGHVRRDLSIVRELRGLVPGLEVDWLAQHPVSAVLAEQGETVHPASAQLASESGHIESESGEHELNVFQALRTMDEVLLRNFSVFEELTRSRQYDLWVGDEAWDVDHHLHENPELKSAPYAWLSDFVGLLPMPEGGSREVALTADYNAEMIEHIARHPRLRDVSIFIGEPGDVVPGRFGPGLPRIRAWTERHFQFSGYVLGYEPPSPATRADLRQRLGYRPEEKVCIVTVGGSGVGLRLLERITGAREAIAARVPDLRMVVVTGPRIETGALRGEGIEVRPFMPDLHLHLAACDIALVQGGLTTCMELVAARRPFIYFPLRHHFEQNLHVHHRLRRYRAGRKMDYECATPEAIASAVADELARTPGYRPLAPGGARRAAEMLAALL